MSTGFHSVKLVQLDASQASLGSSPSCHSSLAALKAPSTKAPCNQKPGRTRVALQSQGEGAVRTEPLASLEIEPAKSVHVFYSFDIPFLFFSILLCLQRLYLDFSYPHQLFACDVVW